MGSLVYMVSARTSSAIHGIRLEETELPVVSFRYRFSRRSGASFSATVLFFYSLCGVSEFRVFPDCIEARFCFANRFRMCDDPIGVVLAKYATDSFLLALIDCPRFMDTVILYLFKFGNPAAYEGSIGVVVAALLYGVVDAERVDPGGSALHLYLSEVDSRLVV